MALHGIFADAAGIRLGPVGAEEKAFVHFAIIEVKNSLAIASVQSIYIYDIYRRISLPNASYSINASNIEMISLSFHVPFFFFFVTRPIIPNVGYDKYRTELSLRFIISHNRITQNG